MQTPHQHLSDLAEDMIRRGERAGAVHDLLSRVAVWFGQIELQNDVGVDDVQRASLKRRIRSVLSSESGAGCIDLT